MAIATWATQQKDTAVRKGGSKQKGNGNESAIAKLLSTWWGETFNRIPNSGALRWKGSTFTYGDLLPPESCPVVIECKHYKDINLQGLLPHGMENNSHIIQWWDQVMDDVNREFFDRISPIGKTHSVTENPLTPLLIVKSNHNDRMIILQSLLAARMGVPSQMNSLNFVGMADEGGPLELTICALSEFLKYITREQFLKARGVD